MTPYSKERLPDTSRCTTIVANGDRTSRESYLHPTTDANGPRDLVKTLGLSSR